MNLAVFLDRDGVLTAPTVRGGLPYAPLSIEDTRLLPDSRAACARLKDAGYLLIMVTNQPDVARGALPREVVESANLRIRNALGLDDVYTCLHDDADECLCRKPKPGMLLDAATKWGIDLGRSYMLGDRWRDIEAGRSAGCQTILVDWHYLERMKNAPDIVVETTSQAVDYILGRSKK